MKPLKKSRTVPRQNRAQDNSVTGRNLSRIWRISTLARSLGALALCASGLILLSGSAAEAKGAKASAPAAETQAAAVPQKVAVPMAQPTAAASCVGCHGPGGVSANDLWPNLAGQKRDYIAKQLRAFHDGERKDPLMSAIAQTLSESDIVELANYFSQLKASL